MKNISNSCSNFEFFWKTFTLHLEYFLWKGECFRVILTFPWGRGSVRTLSPILIIHYSYSGRKLQNPAIVRHIDSLYFNSLVNFTYTSERQGYCIEFVLSCVDLSINFTSIVLPYIDSQEPIVWFYSTYCLSSTQADCQLAFKDGVFL